MTDRIEEFSLHGKRYVYFDMSNFRTNGEFKLLIDFAKPILEKYKKPVYTIANAEGIRFDSETNELIAGWMKHNTPYVDHCMVIGMDGIKQIMLDDIIASTGRVNVGVANNKEQAIEKLKVREWKKWDKW
jgi:hypothetical protein